jgi:hypothetical protein
MKGNQQTKAPQKVPETEEVYKLPPVHLRELNIQTLSMGYQDTSDLIVSKNFESSEGIGWCFLKNKLYMFGGIGTYYDPSVFTYNPKTHKFSKMLYDTSV